MRRRYNKRTYNKDKYSVEHTIIRSPNVNTWTQITNGRQWVINVLPPTDLEGMRKVKHITLSFSNQGTEEVAELNAIYYALVYVPAGYDVNPINIPAIGAANNLYEPNQFVMSSGVLDFTGGPLRIRTRLARNLNSGDRLALAMASSTNADQYVQAEITYAITLQ